MSPDRRGYVTRLSVIAIPAGILLAGMLSVGVSRSQQPVSGSSVAGKPANLGVVTGYAEATAIDLPQRTLRNALFDNIGQEPPVSEQSKLVILNYHDTFARPDMLSLSLADAVVVGTATRVRSHLSNDAKAIYTEVILNVEKVLENRSAAQIAVNQPIAIEQQGGVIQMPSGIRLVRECPDEAVPYPRRRYLFTLKYAESAQAFRVVAGFLLDGETVYCLESLTRQPNGLRLISPYSEPVSQFLTEAQSKISQQE